MAELARSLKGYALSAWEIYLLREQGSAVEARDQKVESFEQEDHLSLALRVLSQDRLGFGYATDFRPEQLKELVEGVFSRMKESDPDQFLGFPEGSEPAPDLPGIYDPGFEGRSEKEKIQMAMRLERNAYAVDSRIKRVRECQYNEGLSEVRIRNSFGLDRKGMSTIYNLSTSALAEQGKEAQISWEFDWSFRYDMLAPDQVGKKAGEKAILKLGGKQIKSVKAPVIFSPEVAGEFLELMSYAFSGENLVKNKTWLRGEQGKKIFSEPVTIIDNGLLLKGPDCFPFDSEGLTGRRKVLVEKGVVEGFLFDSYYGRKFNTPSTANARREQASVPPTVGPGNFYLEPGSRSQEELIAGIGSGMLIKETMGMHTADEISGEFSVGASGLWIEQGKIRGPVSGVAISGTLRDLFSRVRETGSDLRFIGNCASPSLLVEDLEISGN